MAAGSSISLCYDPDNTWNGNEQWIEIGQKVAANGNDYYTWNTTGVAPGTYSIGGYLWSDGQPTHSHLAQSFKITASGGSVVDPAALYDSPQLLTGQQLAPIVAAAQQPWVTELDLLRRRGIGWRQ